MTKVGFIGYGSMGSMLINGFINSKTIKPNQILLSTRDKSKINCLSEKWPEIEMGENIDVVQKSNYVFICVKPLEVNGVLQEIKEYLSEDTHIVSIAACVQIVNISHQFTGKITKVIPSLTSEVKEGISLICHNSNVDRESADYIEGLFNTISTVKVIKEENFEAAADLTSCAPGLISAIFQEFVEAGVRNSSLTLAEAEVMVINTLYGTSKLLFERNMNFVDTISRVATKGGITEEGVRVLKSKLPFVFDEVFKKTIEKHEKVKGMVTKQFENN